MAAPDELWRQVLSALEYHRKKKDNDALGVLNRLVHEWVPQSGSVGPETYGIEEISIPLEELRGLELRHERSRPKRLDGPIVVLASKGRRMVIDGNTRANAWKAAKCVGPFNAIVISPKGNAV